MPRRIVDNLSAPTFSCQLVVRVTEDQNKFIQREIARLRQEHPEAKWTPSDVVRSALYALEKQRDAKEKGR